ncbi:thymidine kinase [Limosilactobacillus mucosae]|uniref:Thymidine kinase n=1 Tax=Limosilactobacillus mucosae TaxID=97478 RepID=A0AAJ1HRW6_LIMMU|nr:thymidine kinase [Limosilactobacillus mucosae]MDD6453926.1 thymidine kinase [Lactobacillus sp.]MDO5013972.1 thymidine kinase [Lactobacillaceae bacterium]NME33292.1 thymidine kinase [Lactobacillus sp. MRS-253-APC-2B]MDC2829417.1 thymidine kinase [Limosilactobacillus mucosae]MDC2837100.1 thymidine kinase [Limosilactobacillus mucosae]
MAQLFFKYGAMNSGKSIDVLKVAHNYEEQGKPVVLLTSGVDTRSGRGTIASRIGLERKVYPIMKDTDVYEYVKNIDHRIYCVLIDEAQFLSKEHVLQLTRIVDELNIPVMTFGLKNDFRNELFEGSKYLLIYADKIEEMKTICWFCPHKATMNLRMLDGHPVYEGEQVQIGGNESYYPVCRKHYFHPLLNKKQEK